MSISTEDIKLLRESTGAGVLDCKKALQETNGDVDAAIEVLRKKGLAAASKKASREANEGKVSAEVSQDRKVGVMVKVNCETDFVARTEDFQAFVAALVRQMLAQPELASVDALLAAPYIDERAQTVSEKLTEIIAKLGENTLIRDAVRFDLDGVGMIEHYVHMGGRVGVLVEVSGSQPGNARFVELAHDLALQIAASSPLYVTESEIPAAMLEAEKNIYRAQLAEDKKPDNIKERIIEGKVKKWYSEVVLLNQEFVKDTNLTIAQLLEKYSKELGTQLKIRRFARFELGAS
ncbi:MAG: translation elongation factor Ts [Chloroflexota bacterium]